MLSSQRPHLLKDLTITIQEPTGADRQNEPVSISIPFPEGTLSNVQGLLLQDSDGNDVPYQGAILARWSDGSIKWLLLDFMVTVSANGIRTYSLCLNPSIKKETTSSDMPVRRKGQGFQVKTKSGVYQICTDADYFFRWDKNDGQKGEAAVNCTVAMTGANGEIYCPRPHRIEVETEGPLKTVIKIEGAMSGAGSQAFCDFLCRISFYRGRSDALIKFCIRNPRAALHSGGLWDLGDPASIYFRDLSILLDISNAKFSEIIWDTGDANHIQSWDEIKQIVIYQDSSGGENWKSSNHINRHGELPLSFKGYKVYVNGVETLSSLRAQPVLCVRNQTVWITCAVKQFWQNFPKALEATPRSLKIHLFPEQFSDLFELQGGEQKTHEIFLSFDQSIAVPERLKNWCAQPLVPQIDPVWYGKSGAIRYLCISTWDEKGRLDAWISTVTEGPNSFFERREIIDEYGWRNFGDCFADHEAFERPDPAPIISHYNNQYDLIYSFLIQYMRSKDQRWFELASDLARHVIDIDIYHTEEDRYSYNGGLHWHTNHFLDAATATHRCFSKKHKLDLKLKNYGGGPSLDHNYTTGLMLYYYLTGDPDAREAVLTLGDWAARQVDGPVLFLENLEHIIRETLKGKTKHEENSNIPYGLLDGPGRSSGNALNALLDAFQLTGSRNYLKRAEEIIQNCVHPLDDIEKRNLLNVNTRWMYLIFLQSLAKYLDVKKEHYEIDYMYNYARLSLISYARWMATHERPFLSEPEKLDFPNFATRAAQDLRKCNVLLLSSQYADEGLRKLFHKKAIFFFEQALNYLEYYEKTRLLTRPLALMMQNGGVLAFFKKYNVKPAHKFQVNGLRQKEGLKPIVRLKKCTKRLLLSALYMSPKKEWRWLRRRIAELKLQAN